MPRRTIKHRLSYRAADLPEAWAAWEARDTRGFSFSSMLATGGLVYTDARREPPQAWHIANADRFPPCESLDQFKRRLRAYFTLWGGREGPQLQRKATTIRYKEER